MNAFIFITVTNIFLTLLSTCAKLTLTTGFIFCRLNYFYSLSCCCNAVISLVGSIQYSSMYLLSNSISSHIVKADFLNHMSSHQYHWYWYHYTHPMDFWIFFLHSAVSVDTLAQHKIKAIMFKATFVTPIIAITAIETLCHMVQSRSRDRTMNCI